MCHWPPYFSYFLTWNTKGLHQKSVEAHTLLFYRTIFIFYNSLLLVFKLFLYCLLDRRWKQYRHFFVFYLFCHNYQIQTTPLLIFSILHLKLLHLIAYVFDKKPVCYNSFRSRIASFCYLCCWHISLKCHHIILCDLVGILFKFRVFIKRLFFLKSDCIKKGA